MTDPFFDAVQRSDSASSDRAILRSSSAACRSEPPGEVHLHRLRNGLRLAVCPLPHLRSATIALAFAVGSRHETNETQGLSHLLEHMLHRGTPRYPSSYALNRAIEGLGGDLTAGTCADVTTYTVTLPAPSIGPALDVLVDMFTSPRLGELALEKDIVREEILECLDGDGECIDPYDLSRRLLWGDHPLGRSILGTLETVERFTEADLRRHLARYYGAENGVLAVAGPVDVGAIARVAEATFGRLSPGRPAVSAPPPAPSRGPVVEHVEDAGSQTTVRLSFPAFGERDPRSSSLAVLSRLLDDGMSARLHRALIDDTGLAYEAWAGLDLHADCGVLDVSGTCAHEKAPALLRAMLDLLGDLRYVVEAEELEFARRRALWSLEASVDDVKDVAEHAVTAVLFDLPRNMDELSGMLHRVTREQVAQVAQKVLRSEGLHVVTVGVLEPGQREEVDAIARRWHPLG